MRPSIAPFLCHAQHGDRRGAGPGNYTSVEASAGKARAADLPRLGEQELHPARPPTICVTQAPKAGSPDSSSGRTMTAKVAGCPKIKVPAQVVLYQAGGYAGPCRLRGDGFQRRAAAAAFLSPWRVERLLENPAFQVSSCRVAAEAHDSWNPSATYV